ncbi:MAG: heavy-metal-associated domain-containing protein [Rikenellaceae bacterium]|nr:heavy-metal-associated domain-containing protein [Rikenellaceae bacterium]
MKKLVIIIALALFAAGGLNAAPESQQGKKNTETVVYDVNVHCHNCKAIIERHIPFERGIKDMDVDLDGQRVTVKYDPRKNDPDAIAEAIRQLGYTCTVAEPEE